MPNSLPKVIRDAAMCFSSGIGGGQQPAQPEITVTTHLNVSRADEIAALLDVRGTFVRYIENPKSVVGASTLEGMMRLGVNSLIIAAAGVLSEASAIVSSSAVSTPPSSQATPIVPPFLDPSLPRPHVAVHATLPIATELLVELIAAVEHSLQVSCLVSPSIYYGLNMITKFATIEPFDRCYAAKAAESARPSDSKRPHCFQHTVALLNAADLDATTVELPEECARVDLSVALNCELGFSSASVAQVAVFRDSVFDPSVSTAPAARLLLEQLSSPSVALTPSAQREANLVGPLGACVSFGAVDGLSNLLLLVNVHTVKGRTPPQLGTIVHVLKQPIERLYKNIQRRHTDIFLPKRVLQARAVIPQVSAAMAAIISRSPNVAFKEESMRILGLVSGADVKARLTALLENSIRHNNTAAADGTAELLADGSVPDLALSDDEDNEADDEE